MHEEITYKNYVYNFVYWMVKVINDLLKNTFVLVLFNLILSMVNFDSEKVI